MRRVASAMTPWQTWWRVNLPLARPAIAAGALLALMETVPTTVPPRISDCRPSRRRSIAPGSRSVTDWLRASWRPCCCYWCSRSLRSRSCPRTRAILHADREPAAGVAHTAVGPGSAWAACAACLLQLLLGFVVPVILVVRLLVPAWSTIDWSRYMQWLTNTLSIGIAGAVVAMRRCPSLAYAARAVHRGAPGLAGASARAPDDALGYAVPGAVIAVGILMPLAAFDNRLDACAADRSSASARAAADRLGVRAALRLSGALLRRGLSGGRCRARPYHAVDRRQRAQPRERLLSTRSFVSTFRCWHRPYSRRPCWCSSM